MEKKVKLWFATLFASLVVMVSAYILHLSSSYLALKNSSATHQKKIFKYFDQSKLSGAFLLSINGKIVSEGYLGYSDFKEKVPLSSSSKFNIGSLAKQMTGFVLLEAVLENNISLVKAVKDYLPELKNYPIGEITIEQLMRMKSGLPHNLNWYDFLTPQLTTQIFTDKDFIEIVKNYKITEPPGIKYQYSNINYVLIGIILGRVYKSSWAKLIQQRIFNRFEMHDSYVEGVNPVRILGIAKPYIRLSIPFLGLRLLPAPHWNYSKIRGAAAVVTTIRDFYKWQIGLTEATKEPKFFKKLFSFKEEEYSYGWEKDEYGNKEPVFVFSHTGEDPGYYSAIARIPQANSFSIFFWNTNSMGPFFDLQEKLILALAKKAVLE